MYITLRVYSIFYEVPPFKTVTYKKKEEKLIMKIYCERYFDFVQKQKTIAWQHIVQLKSFFLCCCLKYMIIIANGNFL